MENTMKRILSPRLLVLALAVATAAVLGAQALASSRPSSRTAGAVVALAKTPLGKVLVDGRGRTLYLFEKDRNGVSMCSSACLQYWPAVTSAAAPHAGTGVRQSLLRLAAARNGMRQVIYAGHPLYRFVGDKRAGQTAGEGLDDFGAEWYAVGADGRTVERGGTTTTGSSGSGGYGMGGW
jgi:predicted lipoprotein with Yx(FWY)xxD motif